MATESRDPKGPGGTTSGGTRAGDSRAQAGGRSQGGRGEPIGAGRPDRIARNLDFVTPKYGWDDARLSDFSILGGGVRGLLDTITSGNTYAGRSPQGFGGGQARGSGGLSEKVNSARLLQQTYPAGYPLDRIAKALGLTPAAPPSPPPMAPPKIMPGPMQTGAKWLGVPGGAAYGAQIPSYGFMGRP